MWDGGAGDGGTEGRRDGWTEGRRREGETGGIGDDGEMRGEERRGEDKRGEERGGWERRVEERMGGWTEERVDL